MALQVNLTLSKTYFLPGELVQVCVQIFNETDNLPQEVTRDSAIAQVLHIKELSFQANGTERTDPSFVHHLHHPEVPAELTDSRKRVRTIFSTESAVLVNDKVLAPHAMQCFQLRFRLPAALPPTFRGSAVRFFYMIHVKAVYEVHRDKLEAVVYETTASTTLTVWPSTTGSIGLQPGPADRRNSSLDYSLRSFGSGLGDSAASEAPPSQHARSGKGNDAADLSGRAETRLSGAGGGASNSPTAAGVPLHTPPLPSSVNNNYGGMSSYCGDDTEVPMCDYVLGKNCRIKWQEIRSEDAGEGLASFASLDSLSRAADGLPSRGVAGAGPAPLPRGVIPFGVNQPFDAPFPLHPALALDTDSDQEDGRGWHSSGSGAPGHAAGTGMVVSPAKASPHVQRQVSGGAPFTRHPSRRSSLFGKVYMLNVGDLPLLRLLLHAPLEAPLQPGATFGGVLDFRQPLALAALPLGAAADRPPMTCYGVAVLLETEEVLAPECRPQNKRDGGGFPCGTPYVIRRLHAEHHDITCDSALTSFMFSLPTTAAPSFRTPMVSLRWVLRFELTVGPRVNFATVDKRARSMRPQLEQLVWSLPLNLRSPVSLAR